MKTIDTGNYLKIIPENQKDMEELAKRYPHIKQQFEYVCDATYHLREMAKQQRSCISYMPRRRGYK